MIQEFYPRTVLSGTGYGAGVEVAQMRDRDGSIGVLLVPCADPRRTSGKGGRWFPGERANALAAAMREALTLPRAEGLPHA